MKEHFQDQGVRKWAGDDLIELQSESLTALQGLVEPYAPCIIKGCEVSLVSGSNYKVSAGLVALPGNDHTGVPCVKVARVDEIPSTVLPVYLTLTYTTDTRVYSDGQSKEISHNYTANVSTVQPEGGDYLTIGVDGGSRLVDTLGITAKLEREGGEAKDVKVTFAQASSRTLPASGSKLGILMGSIRKWLYDLKALAFKDKVAGSDLDADVVDIINNKVDKKAGYALSKNDFTDALLDKLNGIASNANNYALPAASSSTRGGIKIGYSENSNNRAVKLSSEKAYVDIPNASGSANGLMSATDKAKLDGIASNANNYALPAASSSIRGGIKIGYSENSNNRAVKLSSEKAYVDIPNASGSANGLMSATDKAKLDGIASNANNYALPAASSSIRGGIKIGYSENSNNRAVKTSSEKAYVYIPNASSSVTGLMSASDKAKLDNLDGGAVRFTSLDISTSSANPMGGMFDATNSATLYNQGIRAGDLLFYNINGGMSEFCVGRVLSASSSKVVVSYMDDTSIPNRNNRLFPKYNVVGAYSNGLMSSSDKQTLDSLDEDVSDLLKIHPIYVKRIQVSSGGGITNTFSRGVSGIGMTITYSPSPEGLTVRTSGTATGDYSFIIPVVTGESNGACFIDGNNNKGNFNVRMSPKVAGGSLTIFLFGIQ